MCNASRATGIAFSALVAFTATGCGPRSESLPPGPQINGVELSAVVREAAAEIEVADLTATITKLAADELQGRGPATAGDIAARAFIAERFAALGLAPGAADGSWEQTFNLVSNTAAAPAEWRFQAPQGPLALRWWDDYIASSGVQRPTARIDGADVVFVGYGIEAPEHQWDDYKGVDMRGKVLLMLNDDPDWDPQLFEGERRLYYGRWTYKYEIAAAKGAAAAIILHTDRSAGYPWQVVQSSWTGPQFELPAGEEPRIEVSAWVTEAAASALVEAAGLELATLVEAARSRDFVPMPLGLSTSLELTNTVAATATANVIGVLRGSDPELADEAVVFTAHHDHLGVGEPDAEGDTIYNGARDNAAGVAQLLDIARAFTSLPQPPRRSIVFLAVGAEEQGLLGSAFYARHPTFPAGKIAANLNFDGPNIWGPTHDLALVGKGKSELDAIAEAVAQLENRRVVGEADPTQGSFYRSDQFNFAKIGVPALYFDEGTDFVDKSKGLDAKTLEEWNRKNYHQPSDEMDATWDLGGAVADARAGFLCGWVLANQLAMPAWLPGDEFEAARKAALASVSP